MNWIIRHIQIRHLPDVIQRFKKDIENGNTEIENIRCIYQTDNSTIIHMLSIFDFLDLNIEESTIRTFALCQVIKN